MEPDRNNWKPLGDVGVDSGAAQLVNHASRWATPT